MKYLGIDYGLKKIGLALSEGTLASPFAILTTTSLANAFSKVESVITKEGIEVVVIGVSESGLSRQITQAFIAKLKSSSPVQIIEVAETLSTQNAKKRLRELGVSKEKRKQDDSMAAAVLLQEYLDGFK